MSTPLTKSEFISQLESKLLVLPEGERKNALDYYSTFISNAEDESATIAGLGAPGEVAADILASYVKRESQAAPIPNSPHHGSGGTSHAPHSTVGATPIHPTKTCARKTPWWLIVILAIFAGPIIIGLVAGLGGGLIGILAAICSAIFALAVSGITFIVTGAASVALSIFIIFQDAGFGLQAAGIGLILIGCGILLVRLGISIAKWIIAGIKSIVRRLQNGRAKTV